MTEQHFEYDFPPDEPESSGGPEWPILPPDTPTATELNVEPDEIVFSDPEELIPIEPNEFGQGIFQMRDYQYAAAKAVYENWQTRNSTLVVLPTGCGKTVLFAEVSLVFPEGVGRVLIVAHREELIDQAAEKVGLHIDQACSIEMGDRRETVSGLYGKTKVLVASIQTLSRPKRRKKFDPLDFAVLIVDECHHATSKSYRSVISYFLSKNPQLRILLVTATPKRADNKALGDIAQSVAYSMDIIEAIDEGWLVPIVQKLVRIEGLDFSKCRSVGGDINQKELNSVMMGGVGHKVNMSAGMLSQVEQEQAEQQEAMLHAVAEPTIKESQGRPTLVFCVTKAHAYAMAEVFNRYPGVTCEAVTDDTPKDDRKRIIGEFRAQQLQILCSVGVLTEGFDARVDFVVMARPTESETLYRQIVGRGTRPLPGLVDKYDTAADRREAIENSNKPFMTVLDFVGNTGKHTLMSTVDILGGDYEEDVIAAAKAKLEANEDGSDVEVRELLRLTKAEIEEKEKQRQLEKELREQKERERLEQERAERDADTQRRKHIRAEVSYSLEDVPIKNCHYPEVIGVCDGPRGTSTDAQVRFLVTLGVMHETACAYSKQQAGAVISNLSSKTGGDWIMRIGKYMGNSISTVAAKDPGYLNWCRNNFPAGGDFHTNYNLMMRQRQSAATSR